MKSQLASVLASICDQKTMQRLLREIFTEAELRDFELRWRLMQRLQQGHSQRKIAAELGISLCKITRGSKIVQNKRSVTSSLLNPTGKKGNSDARTD